MEFDVQSVKQIRKIVSDFHARHSIGDTAADAFVAWWLTRRYEVSPEYAGSHAPGGNYDFGLDGFHFTSEASGRVLHLIQGKFAESLSQLKKAIQDFDKTLKMIKPVIQGGEINAATVNSVLNRLAAALEKESVPTGELELRFEVLHLCNEPAEIIQKYLEPTRRKFEDAVHTILPDHKFSLVDVNPAHELERLGPQKEVPTLPVVLRFAGTRIEAGTDSEFYQYYAGISYLSDLVDLYKARGDSLFARNVRMFLYKASDKGPAKYMRNTLRQICMQTDPKSRLHPERFAVLHNGITLHVKLADQGDGKLTVREPNVLNGCQTIKNAFFFSEDPHIKPHIDSKIWKTIPIPLRVVVSSDRELVREVAVANNRQKELRPSAFRANDELQLLLADRFNHIGIFYERQEAAFENHRRSGKSKFEEDFPNSPDKPLTMEDVAQVLAIASDRPALSVAKSVSNLFDDSSYRAVFSTDKLVDLPLVVFLRNLFTVMPLVLKDMRDKSSKLETLPVAQFKYPCTKLLARYIRKHDPEMFGEYGSMVFGSSYHIKPLRERVRKLTAAQNSGLQQLLPEIWFDEEQGLWRSPTDPHCLSLALNRLTLQTTDVFCIQ